MADTAERLQIEELARQEKEREIERERERQREEERENL
jgi:hypothetical protein